jgi:hypothetical protein
MTAALKQPVGSIILVTADLALGPGVPRLCDKAVPDCTGAYAAALGIKWRTQERWAVHGPFVARVGEDGLSDFIVHGPFYIPAADPKFRHREWQTLKFDGGLFAASGVEPDGLSIGAESSLGGRLTPWRLDGVFTGLVGEDVGLSLRARWLTSVKSGLHDFRVGLAPLLEHSDVDRQWSYPSPLGLLLPELGVGRRESESFPYLGWSLPVSRRFVSPLLRRHPFTAEDVLGVRVAATVLVSFRQTAIETTYLLSAGVTVW